MSSSNPGLILAHTAEADIAGRRLVKFGTADGAVVQAAAAGDSVIGVSERVGADKDGRCDVILTGVAEVEAGGAIARGALVASDGDGKAVAAVAGNRVAGIAMVSAVADGDFIPVRLVAGVY